MERDLVSIIVPTCNRPLSLLRALESAIQQTHTNLEIIVVNDAGADPSREITSLNDSRIYYLSHAENRGPSAARNTALKHSKGKYIAYLDDDDLYYPEHIESLLQTLKNSGCQVAYADGYIAYLQDNGFIERREPFTFSIKMETLLVDNRLPPVAVMHARSCLNVTGLFDESLKRHEDWDLWIRLLQHFPWCHYPSKTFEYSRYKEQAIALWSGYFLNSMQMIHLRYADMADQFIAKEQFQCREKLRVQAYQQLELMGDQEVIEKSSIFDSIVQNALHLTLEDVKWTQAITQLLVERFPAQAQFWLLHARLSRALGDFLVAKNALIEALELSQTPEILQELIAVLRSLGDVEKAAEIQAYLDQM